MSRRRKPQHHRPTPPEDLGTPRRECPDCLADSELDASAPGVWLLTIRHDPTCPRYRDLTRRRNTP
jgi:hypothetical protein